MDVFWGQCIYIMYADHNDGGLWNPMAEDFLSERNSYQVDVNDPGVATVGYGKLPCCDLFDLSCMMTTVNDLRLSIKDASMKLAPPSNTTTLTILSTRR